MVAHRFSVVGRLREIAFRAVGEGSNKRRDIDKYDMDYQHLVLWDAKQLELVGAYRLACTDIIEKHGRKVYIQRPFSYSDDIAPYLERR